jgi:superfamily II DNA/RNA helicase
MLFSATMPKDIVSIARRHMNQGYATINIGREEEPIVTSISHNYVFAKGRMKFAVLLAFIAQFSPKKCIIFSRTKHESEIIHELLVKQGFDAILMHGGLTQAKREYSLHCFKAVKAGAQFMIATNIAARGLDIDDVTDIINFDAPDAPEDYVHRVGRSARMGKEGRAFTILGFDEKGLLNAIQRSANITIKELHLDVGKYTNIEIPEARRRRPFSGGFNRDHPSTSRGHSSGHGGGQYGGQHKSWGDRQRQGGRRGYSKQQ